MILSLYPAFYYREPFYKALSHYLLNIIQYLVNSAQFFFLRKNAWFLSEPLIK